MRLFAAVLMAAFFVSACETIEPVETVQECGVGLTEAAPLLAEWRERGLSEVPLEGEVAQNLVDFVNGMEPPTNWRHDSASLFYNRHAAAVVIVVGDCLWTSGPRPHAEIEAFMRAAQDVPTDNGPSA